MKYLKLTDLGYELKIDSSATLPDGCIELSDSDYIKLSGDDFIYKGGEIVPYVATEYIPTIEDLAEAVRLSLQSAIDAKAKSFGFSGGNALMLYAGFTNPFQPLAQVFATWEASVWVEADAYKSDVIKGIKPMLSGSEAVALMPVYPS